MSVDDYVRKIEQAGERREHVAVITYYRDMVDEIGHDNSALPVLMRAVEYAQRLKKEGDRLAICNWVEKTTRHITPDGELNILVADELSKLHRGDK